MSYGMRNGFQSLPEILYIERSPQTMSHTIVYREEPSSFSYPDFTDVLI